MAGSSEYLVDDVRVGQALRDSWLTKDKRGMLFRFLVKVL